MSKITYNVWSTYPPVLYKDPSGFLKMTGGTIYKVQVGKTLLPINQRLPESTTLSQIVWHAPVRPKVETSSKVVKGSNGKTYVVSTLPTGRQTCTCPGFSYRRTCKHIGA